MFIDLLDNCDQSSMKGYTPSSTAKYPQDNVTLTQQLPISKFADWSVTCKSVNDVQNKCLGIVGSDRNEILKVTNLFTVYRELEQAL